MCEYASVGACRRLDIIDGEDLLPRFFVHHPQALLHFKRKAGKPTDTLRYFRLEAWPQIFPFLQRGYFAAKIGLKDACYRLGLGRIGRGGGGATFHVRVGPVLTQHMRGWGGTFHHPCWGRVNTSNRWCVVLCVVVLCCVVLCCVVLCCVVLCCAVSFLVLFWFFLLCHLCCVFLFFFFVCGVVCRVVLCCVVLCCVVLCCVVLCCVVLCCVVLCCVVLCCVVLCCVVLRCVVLCCCVLRTICRFVGSYVTLHEHSRGATYDSTRCLWVQYVISA